MTPGRVISGVFLYFVVANLGAAVPDTWHVRPTATSNHLNGVTYGNGLFVAAGNHGTILTSSNGTEWVAKSAGITNSTFLCAAWTFSGFYLGGEGVLSFWRDGAGAFNRFSGNGAEEMYSIVSEYQFLGVGRDRLAGKSYVVYEWKTNGVPTTNVLYAISWRKARHGDVIVSTPLVAVGDRGTIIQSTNGIEWAVQESGTTVPLRAAVYHQDKIIVGGDDGVILTSSNGISWTALPRLSFDIRALASSGIAVVAVGRHGGTGRVQVSADGIIWPGEPLEFAQPLNAVTHGQSSFMAVGDGGLIVQSGYAPDLSVNAWTKPTSGLWEEQFWSCGRLPAADQGMIALTNAGSKSLEIGRSTTANFSNALSLFGLTVEAPAESSNQLLLNNAGTNVPLDILYLTLGTNASLVSYSSALSAYEADLSSPALFAENSMMKIGRIRLFSELTFSNSYTSVSFLLVRPDRTVQQFGGSNYMYRAGFNGGSSFTLSGGVLSIKELYLQSALPNWEGISTNGSATFIQNEGETTAEVMKLGMWGLGSSSRRGEFVLQSGLVKCASLEFFNGGFTQTGGTNIAATMNIPNHRDCAGGNYYLSNGVLVSGGLGLGMYSINVWPFTRGPGHFVQSGGVHISSGISLAGFLINAGRSVDKNVIRIGRYSLSGGLLKSDGVHVGGQFTQTGGTNHALHLSVSGGGEYLLTDGELTTSRAHVSGVRLNAYNCWGSGGITQEGGTHSIENNLTIGDDGGYHLKAGTLITSNITIGLRGDLTCSGGVLSNHGTITLRGGTFSPGRGDQHPGKLELQEVTGVTPWPCLPATNSLFLSGSDRAELRFRDSSDVPWTGAELWIIGWSAEGGSQRLFFGTNAQGLTEEQLSKLVFVNPVGWRPGLYQARILKTGEVVPAVPPALTATREPRGLILSWPGKYDLFTATNILGPFLKVEAAASPVINPFNAPQQFFQLPLREQ